MPRPKRILNGDDYKSKTEKMIGLPKKYPSLSKTEKMVYLPRFYYNNYEKIDEGYLNNIPINYQQTIVKFELRPDTTFGYPTWKSVFGGTDFIQADPDLNAFLFNGSATFGIDFYSYLNENDVNQGYVYAISFLPFIGYFYDAVDSIEWKDNNKFGTTNTSPNIPLYALFNTNGTAVKMNIRLFNNNRAKIIPFKSTPLL